MNTLSHLLPSPKWIRLLLLVSIFCSASARPADAVTVPLLLPDAPVLDALDSVKVYGDFIDIRLRPAADVVEARWTANAINAAALTGETVHSEPTVTVSDGALILRAHSDAQHHTLDLALPATWAFQLQVYGAGNIDVQGISGSLTAWSARGHISVVDHSGSLSVTAMDGEVKVQFAGDALAGTSAITMHHGVIGRNTLQVAVPQTLRATLRIHNNSTVLSNIPALQSLSPVLAGDTAAYAEANLNGGGALLTLRNLDGDIHINAGEI